MQAEELQSSLVSEEHTHLGQEMARLREARARFHAERREAEEGLRAVCTAAGVQWTMEPLPTPAEEEALAAAQQAEMEERTSKLEALLTAAGAPSAPQGAETQDIDYNDADEDDDGDQADGMSPETASGSRAAGDSIDYDEEDDEGDTEDDEAAISAATSGLPDNATAAGDDIDYDEEDDDDGDTEDDEVSSISAPSLRCSDWRLVPERTEGWLVAFLGFRLIILRCLQQLQLSAHHRLVQRLS